MVASVEDTVQGLLELYMVTTLNDEDDARHSPIDSIRQAHDAALLSAQAAQTCARSNRNSAVLSDNEVSFAPSLQLPPHNQKNKLTNTPSNDNYCLPFVVVQNIPPPNTSSDLPIIRQ